jgi:hypothetical protein
VHSRLSLGMKRRSRKHLWKRSRNKKKSYFLNNSSILHYKKKLIKTEELLNN